MSDALRSIQLRGKLALLAAILTLGGIAAGLTIVYWSLYQLRIAAYDNESRLIAGVVLDSAVLREDQSVRIPRVVESYLTDESGVSAAQVYVDGELIWEGGVIDAPRPLDAARLVEGAGAVSVDDWRVFTRRDEEAGIVVQVGRPLLGVREVLGPFNAIALPLTLVLAGVSGVLAWWIAGIALRPLRRLAAAAQEFEHGADVPAIEGDDEPARLARAFSELLGRLREERRREQRFLEYASHELRTPISALRAGLEGAATGGMTPTRELLGRLHREALRLETLAQNLLALSRAESGSIRMRAVALDDVAADAYDRLQPLAVEKGLDLRLAAEPAEIRGDPRLLAQALDNLAANAIRFTARGSIVLRSGVRDGFAVLEVCDTGPGLPDQVEEGLGLRVARAVAIVHGGRLELDVDGGTCARLAMPSVPRREAERAQKEAPRAPA